MEINFDGNAGLGSRRRVVFHVGQSKAGSTSIQNYLETQRDALIERGVLFARTGFSRKNPFDQSRTSGHLGLVRSLQGRLAKEFEEEISGYPDHTVLLSVENLFADLSEEILKEIGAYFKEWDVEITAVLRPQFNWLRSRYVENVMSGFLRRVSTFDQFLFDVMALDTLDYEARIALLETHLGATRVRAIRFESSKGPLVSRFLEAAGLPLTAPPDALSIHANRREKLYFLVEAKRRLNQVTEGMTGAEQLELEAEVREASKVLVAAGKAPDTRGLSTIPMKQAQRAVLWLGNKSLEARGVLDEPLDVEEGQLLSENKNLEGEVEPAVDVLFWKGMDLAADIAARSGQTGRFASSPLQFTKSERNTLRELFAQHPVSAHMGAPETAILAAAGKGRLVKLFLEPKLASYIATRRLDAIVLPSVLVTLIAAASERKSASKFFKAQALSNPDLVVAGPETDRGFLRSILVDVKPAVLILLGEVDPSFVVEFVPDFTCQRLENCMILKRQPVTA